MYKNRKEVEEKQQGRKKFLIVTNKKETICLYVCSE
jgi:hypothetical protein